MTLVHPYDDPLIMAGQGTIALEMLEDAPELDTLGYNAALGRSNEFLRSIP